MCRSDGDPKCADPFDNRQPVLIFHHHDVDDVDEDDVDDDFDDNVNDDGDDDIDDDVDGDVQVVPNHRLPARSQERAHARP